jgi:hypothetical protein
VTELPRFTHGAELSLKSWYSLSWWNIPLYHFSRIQLNPVDTLTYCFCSIHLDIILPSASRCVSWCIPSAFHIQRLYPFFISLMRTPGRRSLIREVSVSNLDPETGCPDRDFRSFLQFFQVNSGIISWNRLRARPFTPFPVYHLLSSSHSALHNRINCKKHRWIKD